MAADFSRLRADVQKNNDLIQSGITLIQGMAQQIRDAVNGPDPQGDINALADQMESQAATFSAAIAANTPAAPSTGSTGTTTGA